MIKKLITKLASLKLTRFVLVGILNTIIGTSVMFFCYNVLKWGYWVSSALNYIVGSIFSYFANKYFTFEVKQKSLYEIFRFIINISVCYLLAYGIAKPLIRQLAKMVISTLNVSIIDQISMLLGMGLFVCFNYIGQKYFVFKKIKG